MCFNNHTDASMLTKQRRYSYKRPPLDMVPEAAVMKPRPSIIHQSYTYSGSFLDFRKRLGRHLFYKNCRSKCVNPYVCPYIFHRPKTKQDPKITIIFLSGSKIHAHELNAIVF